MVPLDVVVANVLSARSPERARSKEDQLVETLALDRPFEALGVRVEVRATSRQAEVLHIGVLEYLQELRCELSISVVDQESLVAKEAILAVHEIAAV